MEASSSTLTYIYTTHVYRYIISITESLVLFYPFILNPSVDRITYLKYSVRYNA